MPKKKKFRKYLRNEKTCVFLRHQTNKKTEIMNNFANILQIEIKNQISPMQTQLQEISFLLNLAVEANNAVMIKETTRQRDAIEKKISEAWEAYDALETLRAK